MADGKIEFELGSLKFSGEGTEAWVEKQLDWLFKKLTDLKDSGLLQAAAAPHDQPQASASPKPVQVTSLASHIKSKGGDSNQAQRFLATADWLRLKGEQTLKTGIVSKALSDNHQKKLANAADCLNKNVTKGYCEKSGDGFYITPEGLTALGHSD